MFKLNKIQYLPDRLEYHDKTMDADIYAGCIGDDSSDPMTLAVITKDWGDGTSFAKRLVSCWNACEHLEHPESDIKKLVEALKLYRDKLYILAGNTELVSPELYQLMQALYLEIDEALALVKEN